LGVFHAVASTTSTFTVKVSESFSPSTQSSSKPLTSSLRKKSKRKQNKRKQDSV